MFRSEFRSESPSDPAVWYGIPRNALGEGLSRVVLAAHAHADFMGSFSQMPSLYTLRKTGPFPRSSAQMQYPPPSPSAGRGGERIMKFVGAPFRHSFILSRWSGTS